MADEQVVLVVGLHSSGTSALAGVLHELGVDMGTMTDDRGASHPPHNPYGQYEDAKLVELLNQLLGHWHVPRLETLPPEGRAQVLTYLDYRSAPLWGMKDPRLCHAATILLHELQERGANIAVLFTERHFDTCVYRLAERDRMPKAVAEYIQTQCWLYRGRTGSYCQDRDIPFRSLYYRMLVEHTEHSVDALIDFLELEPTDAQRAAAVAHIRPAKKHWHEP